MRTADHGKDGRSNLRSRAVVRLRGQDARSDAATALGVLYELASSPEGAPDALALLHELQVHQVEVDLQDEELRRSRDELESLLTRQLQMYDAAPVAQLTLDGEVGIVQLNRTAAAALGADGDSLRGLKLDSLLDPGSAATLHQMLGRLSARTSTAYAELHLMPGAGGEMRRIHASASLDAVGGGYFLGWVADEQRPVAPDG